MNPLHDIFEPAGMAGRRRDYFRFVRERTAGLLRRDGSYDPGIDQDRRMSFFVFLALVDGEDEEWISLAQDILANTPCWDEHNIFTTSSIASIAARERRYLTPELERKCLDHLDRCVLVDEGRGNCAGCNDYMFHGFNDNMPAMATRSLILAGDLLDRPDLSERGMVQLHMLADHFIRRGLISEYNSPTYSPITFTALMDVAETTRNAEAGTLARQCAERVLLDILCHWHPEMACPMGSASRAYLNGMTPGMNNLTALMWYLSGTGLDPGHVYGDGLEDFVSRGYVVHHGPDPCFGLCSFCEQFTPDYAGISDDVVAFARAERSYPYEVRADTDSGRTAHFQTRAFAQPQWSLGTSGSTMWREQAGQHLTLRAFLRHGQRTTSIWHSFLADTEYGDRIPAGYGDLKTERSGFKDAGHYHTAQKAGTAMVVGHLGPWIVGQRVQTLRFMLVLGIPTDRPDEMKTDGNWFFLRYGEVFVGVRMAGSAAGEPIKPRQLERNGYLRIELPVCEEETTVTDEQRRWTDVAYVLEIASADECTFAEFQDQCRACRWQAFHYSYRNSRYQGRNGDLQIVDSIQPDSLRFITIDGKLEERVQFTATGLPRNLIENCFAPSDPPIDRILYNPEYAGSPFDAAERPANIIAMDTSKDHSETCHP